MKHVGLLLLSLSIACGGGSASGPEPGGGGDELATPAAPDKKTICEGAMTAAMDAHEAAWEGVLAKGEPKSLEDMAAAACQLFCGRSTECAIEDACETLEAGKLADLQLDKTAPENTRQCVDKCNQARLTKEQIKTLGTCAQDDSSSCATFLECAGAAQP